MNELSIVTLGHIHTEAIESLTSQIYPGLHRMPAVCPVQVVSPLEPVFDVQIRIAATPAAELR